MKRALCILMSVVLCAVFLTVSASAETYDLSNTDLTIRVDDAVWYVFTRDNIENNPELEELGIAYDAMRDVLYNGDIYMDAIVYYEDGTFMEFFVRKKAMHTGAVDMAERSDEQVLAMAQIRANQYGAESCDIYKNQYKFARLEYFDANSNNHICEYVTIVNKTNYTFTFQSETAFAEWEYNEMEEIVDSIQFDIRPSTEAGEDGGLLGYVIPGTIGGALAGGAVGGVMAMKKKKKAGQEDEVLPVDATEPE